MPTERPLFQWLETFIEDEGNECLTRFNGVCTAMHLLDFLEGNMSGDDLVSSIYHDLLDAIQMEDTSV